MPASGPELTLAAGMGVLNMKIGTIMGVLAAAAAAVAIAVASPARPEGVPYARPAVPS